MVSSNMNLVKNLFVHTGQEGHGRYCLKFFKEGTWVSVVIDDHFAFNKLQQPLFCQGADKNEIWPMMVEKAYAKLHEGYEDVIEGDVEYALKDLTGGNSVAVDTTKDPKFMEKVAQGKFWVGLKAQLKSGVVGACCNQADTIVVTDTEAGGEEELLDREGILKGWGYPVLDTVEINEKRLKLVKIGSPWGIGEFTGDWSNTSPLWEENADVARNCKKSATEKVRGCEERSDDAECVRLLLCDSLRSSLTHHRFSSQAFWMTMNDFVRIFNVHYYCKVLPEDDWQTVRRSGVFPATGGGCVNFPSWVQNEQILLDVEDEADVVITLTQADDRYQKDRETTNKNSRPAIGVVCHKHNFGEVDLGKIKKLVTMRSTGIELISDYSATREVSCSGKLGIGRYVIIPSTFDPDAGCNYWITIQSNERVNVYAGAEVEWDEKFNDPKLEGDNEMEQDLVQAPTHPSHTFEENSKIIAIRAAAKMVAELTVLARSLEQRKDDLEAKLGELHARVAEVQ